jgi:hypothetical protein
MNQHNGNLNSHVQREVQLRFRIREQRVSWNWSVELFHEEKLNERHEKRHEQTKTMKKLDQIENFLNLIIQFQENSNSLWRGVVVLTVKVLHLCEKITHSFRVLQVDEDSNATLNSNGDGHRGLHHFPQVWPLLQDRIRKVDDDERHIKHEKLDAIVEGQRFCGINSNDPQKLDDVRNGFC